MDEPMTYTQEQFEAALQEKLAEAKAEGDTAFKSLWAESKKAKDANRQAEKELKELRAKLGELEQQKSAKEAGIASESLEKIRAEVRRALEDEYTPYRTQAETLARENRSLKLDNHVKAVMAKAGVRAERIDALFRLNADAFDLTDDGEPYVKNEAGTPIDKYIVDKVRKEYPEWFEGSGSSGGGAAKSHAGSGGRRVISVDEMVQGDNLDKVIRGEIQVER